MEDKKSVILITGASSGIGKALVEVFVKNNFHVVGIARSEKKLKELKKSFKSKKYLFDYFVCDITIREEIEKFLNQFYKKYEINCLINNAGISSFKKAIDDSIEEIDNIIQTNLMAPIYFIKKFLPQMIKRKRGTIINILSVVNKKIFINSSIYSASKSGLEAYTNVLREEHRNDNIKFINVFPGATATEIWPTKTLEKYSLKMMRPQNIAELIFDVIHKNEEISVEELVIKPVTGDL